MLLAKNKKATHNYEIVKKFVAGIKLRGYEVKSVRNGNVNFEGAYVTVEDSVPKLLNLHIGRYAKQSQSTELANPKRPRDLLLNKPEIAKIASELSQKGHTAVPLALVLTNNMVKLELAIVKGTKKYEKKAKEKEKQQQRDLEKELKTHFRG